MDRSATAIVDTALALEQLHPGTPALQIVDGAMEGEHGSSPNFEAARTHDQPWDDWTDPASPFGQLLQRAFAPDGSPQDALDRFAERYRLWDH